MSNVVELRPDSTATLPPSTDNPEADFITRKTINSMSDQQLDDMLEAIRVRRLSSLIVYQKTMEDKIAAESEKAKVKLEKKAEQIVKKLGSIDKHMDELEKFINELRGLRIQAGLELV